MGETLHRKKKWAADPGGNADPQETFSPYKLGDLVIFIDL